MSELKYARINEFNDNEGETWSRFIREDDPLLDKMREYVKKLQKADDCYINESYWFTDRLYTQVEVDLLCEEDACGYMEQFAIAKINEKFDFEYIDDEQAYEMVYKLGWAV